MEERSPEALRAREFSVGIRGYDRAEVDAFKDEVAGLVAVMQGDIDRLDQALHQAGFDDPKDLATELDRVGADVGRILEEARAAAEEMRSRATADSARWRAEADAVARSMVAAAESDARLARGSAWEESTALIDAAADEHDRLLEAAGQDALFIRAEAEREALRLTADARRERDEEARRLREEGDRVVSSARQEAETLIASARYQAEAAQERARALETRRSELMAELEAARASIGMLESEIETKQRVLEDEPLEAEVVAGWPGEEGSVRIVSGSRSVRSHPVDALEIAAEVEAMQRPRPEPAPSPVGAPIVPEPPQVAEPVELPPPPGPEVEPPAAADAPEPAVEAEEIPPPAEETPPVAEAVAQPPEPASPPRTDDLSGLFAALRVQPAEEVPQAAPAPKEPQETAAATPGVRRDDESRDRLLLPVQNRALRGVKREIVDLQNRCLEELRVDESWSPDEALLAGAFADDLDLLARESLVAGFAAAREATGAVETPHPVGVSSESPVDAFVGALLAAVRGSLERSRAAGTPARETASSLSRVFRTWRTDEAERRVRAASEAAFERGYRAALDTLGVSV